MKTLWFIHLDGGRNIVGPFTSDDEAVGVAKVITLGTIAHWTVRPVLIRESE